MEFVTKVDEATLHRRGFSVTGSLLLSDFHVVFQFEGLSPDGKSVAREIWIAYPVIDRISKARGSAWINASNNNNGQRKAGANNPPNLPPPVLTGTDHYSMSHIRLECKDFTFYLLDFVNDLICCEVYAKISELALKPKRSSAILAATDGIYAFAYKPNVLETRLATSGWQLYDPAKEYTRLGLDLEHWRVSLINQGYQFCPLYPAALVVPLMISDNVVKHAGKFRSKQRIPAVVYRHRGNRNHNVIARCAQPLVGLNLQNRSLQDEKLVGEIFRTQEREKATESRPDDLEGQQPQRNLLIDLRPLTNAMAQHALGAGTENIDNYRGHDPEDEDAFWGTVDKIYGNIDNIHVIRESLNKLTSVLNELDQGVVEPMLVQQQLVKSQWLHRVLIILQLVDRIAKLVHLNNTNVVIHCSDGWDRTSQVSALAQLCLDPFYRTLEGFMVLIEKEWVSFGFKFATRADHGGCIGALKAGVKGAATAAAVNDSESLTESLAGLDQPQIEGAARKVASFFQRAAQQVKNAALDVDSDKLPFIQTYSGLSEKSPVFHQFLDCVFQIWRQHPQEFEFNLRFLKRLLYHYYSCQYGQFLCDSERELVQSGVRDSTTSVWDYFLLRPNEFVNPNFQKDSNENDGVVFFSFTDVRWWCELYGRSEEEMNGMANKLEKRFAEMNLRQSPQQLPVLPLPRPLEPATPVPSS